MLRVKHNLDNQRYECVLLFSKRKQQDKAKLASQNPMYIVDARLNNLKYSEYDKFLTFFEQRVNDSACHKTKANIANLLDGYLSETKTGVMRQPISAKPLKSNDSSSGCTLL